MTAQTLTLQMTAPAAARVGDVTGLRARIAPLIAGLDETVPLAGPRDRRLIRAPFTGEAIGSVPVCTAEDVALAAERARHAQHAWAETPLAHRRAIFLRYHDLVLDHQEQLLDLVQIEGGKARRHAVEEIYDVAINARYYAYHAAGFLRPRRRQTPLPILTQAWEYRHPVGRGRHHRAVELPADHGRVGRHPGAVGRQRGAAEARRDHPLHRALRGAAPAGGRPAGLISSRC